MSTEPMPDAEGPLTGYLVVDLSRALAGPHAGMMLADLGARVIKVENPGTGDDTRGWGPPFVGPEDDPQATYFLSCNRNKESIALDLKSDDGRAVLRELLERADVVIENFRPGVLDRLGFSAAQMHALNPALVVLSITGFGHDGPESQRSGYDQILQGEAGLMSLTGSGPDDPQRVGVPIADLLSGMYGAFGTLAALLQRERTGQGQIVRTSLLAALIGVHAFQGTRATVAGEVPQAAGQPPPVHCPLRTVPLPAGQGADQRGKREALEHVRLDVRDRRRAAGVRHQCGPRAQPRESHRRSGAGVLRFRGRAAAHQTQRRRHPGRQGQNPGRSLRMGTGPLAGSGDRRRA